tara:strand:- start:520 stop:1173 length:654 start_codon:yes stop_codon:yes gene_type:complete
VSLEPTYLFLNKINNMSCDLTLGRERPCKDSVGGLKAVYFLNYATTGYSVGFDSTNTDEINSIGSGLTVLRYDLKGNSNLEQTITSSTDTGGTFFEQVLTLVLPKLTVADHKEIKLMSFGRPHIIVKDNNDNYYLTGLEHGMDVTGGTISSGSAMGDLSGYTLTFTGTERAPANFMNISAETNTQLTLGSTTITVTPGTVSLVDTDDDLSGIATGNN